MTLTNVLAEWQQAKNRGIKRHLTLTKDGLLLGADTVVAKRNGTGVCEIDGHEEKILVLMTIAYGRPVPADAISKLRRADEAYSRGDILAAHMHIAFTGLHGIEDDESASLRLFLAHRLLQWGLTPRDLHRAFRDDTPPEPFGKASPDDPKHPGWPAGTAGGLGGKFRPKDGTEAVISDEAKQRIRSLLARRKARQLIGSALRLSGEALISEVPGVGEVSIAAMLGELGTMAAENRQNEIDMQAAIDFLNTRPHTLEELQQAATQPNQPGYENHHIVTQGGQNAENIPQDELQDPKNIVRIPTLVHEDINAQYSRTFDTKSGMTIYQWLQTKPFDAQYEEGVRIMREMRLIQ